MPILDYCDVVWSPCSAFYTRRLERVHSRFVSSIPSSTSAVLDLKLSLTERRTYHTAVKVLKIFIRLFLQDCMFQVLEQTMDEDLSGFVVPLYGTAYPLL